jgi:hypothetical protein
MKGFSSRIRVVCAVVGLALTAEQSAYAGAGVTLRTPSLVPDPKGSVECKVTATSPTPIGIVATIRTSSGANVTEFGAAFQATPAATGDGLYYVEKTAGSLNNRARYCTATVTGAQSGAVHVSLTAYDANHNVIDSIEVP